MKDCFIIWRRNEYQGNVEGEFEDLFKRMVKDKRRVGSLYLPEIGFDLDNGDELIRMGRFAEYHKAKDEINTMLKEVEEKKRIDSIERDRLKKYVVSFQGIVEVEAKNLWEAQSKAITKIYRDPDIPVMQVQRIE